MVSFLDEDAEPHERPELNTVQMTILSYQAMTFALGTHFKCPPHLWDDMPPQRVMLDYMIVRAASEKKAEMIERMTKEAQKQAKMGGNNKGQPIRTTSDESALYDFFDRHNAKLSGEDND